MSSSSNDLDTLESMSFGSVSFEELLGHCNEVYKRNQNDLIELEDRLRNFGYAPGDYSCDVPVFCRFKISFAAVENDIQLRNVV